MQIESNLKSVMSRVERLRDRDIPEAMSRAVRPDRWKGPAYAEAERTLQTLATADQRKFIPAFIQTLQGGVFQTGFFVRMRAPFGVEATMGDFLGARAGLNPSDLQQNLFLKQVQRFEDLVTEWVATEKRKDKKDLGKTDEEIGQFISYLLLTPNPTPSEMEARMALTPHIVDFLTRKQGEERLDGETVDMWLRAVLAAWSGMVCAGFQQAFRSELHGAGGELPL